MKRLIRWGCILAATVCAGAANAQSFDCRKAYFSDEQVICHDAKLAQLDSQLASVFRRAMSRLPWQGRGSLERDEIDWVIARRHCRGSPGCIEQRYRSRIEKLAEMASVNGRDRDERIGGKTPQRATAEWTSQAPDTNSSAMVTRPATAQKPLSTEPSSLISPDQSPAHAGALSSGAAARSPERGSGGSRSTIHWANPLSEP